MTTAKLEIVKIEDHEGSGYCSACGRDNLRWIVTLSDGTRVGTECAKAVLGWKPTPAGYTWVTNFRAVAERTNRYGEHEVLWQHKTGTQTRLTVNGILCTVGGARADWDRAEA